MPDSDFVYCDKYASQKRAKAQELDPQVAMLLLRQCGSFCKMVHLACSAPPSLMAVALQMFDNDFMRLLLNALQWMATGPTLS